jgi:DNA-binding NtrC family response regulator
MTLSAPHRVVLQKMGKDIKSLTWALTYAAIMKRDDLLKQRDWPGNIRQLLNVIRHAAILESGDIISAQTIYHISEEEKRFFNPNSPDAPSILQLLCSNFRHVLITEAEARAIIELLARNRNNKTRTPKDLGLTRGHWIIV